MYNYLVFRQVSLFLLLSVVVLSPGCDIKSPVEGVKVLINEAPLNAVVAIEVIDSSTGSQVALDEGLLYMTLKGQDKGAVTDMTEKSQTEFSASTGYFHFAIAQGWDVSPESPIKLTVVINSDKYIPTSRSIEITSTQGETYTISLMRIDDTPEGVTSTVTSEGTTSDTGEVAETIEIVAEPESETGTQVTVTVTEGTVIKDEEGVVLQGDLTTSVTQFTAQTEESLSAFPGGFVAQVVLTEEETEEVIFTTAGFISLEITDEEGNKAKTFDKPVDITIQIPGDIQNPETGTAIKNGDTVPIWYYDEEKARWVHEGDSNAIGPDANGNYSLPFAVTHLSYWSGGWIATVTECETGLLVHVVGGFAAVDIKVKKQGDGSYFTSLEKNLSWLEPSLRLPASLHGTPVTIEAWYGKDMVGTLDVDYLCDAEVDFPVVIPGMVVSLTVEVYCENDTDRRIRPSRHIYIDDEGGRKYVGFLNEGRITVYGLESGVIYTFHVFDEGEWYSDSYTVTKASEFLEFPIPADRCD
ncbi:hypothetical protein ACFL47_08150 [Candidatus Latescibacterota bacterium]